MIKTIISSNEGFLTAFQFYFFILYQRFIQNYLLMKMLLFELLKETLLFYFKSRALKTSIYSFLLNRFSMF